MQPCTPYKEQILPENLHPEVYRWRPTKVQSAAAFPLGLGEEGMHEVCEANFGDMPALTGFALASEIPGRGAIAWVSQRKIMLDHGSCLPAGFSELSTARRSLMSITVSKLTDALWTIEEAVCSGAVSGVIAEIGSIDFTASRRLALASGRHGVPVILLLPYTCNGSTAASARWRVSPRPSSQNIFDGRAPGYPRWRAVLERSRRAPHLMGKTFDLELNDETLSLSVVSRLAAHAPAPGAPRQTHRNQPGIRKRA